ncbi:MAG TPA: hypothetical protein ACFYEK_07080 [Candidatus Wunengus sp. YC60]|uniref:hypothetical protein n=1 Tax=Candidatus Wunengus sp. YC60 TaxID=3367697 RepID=UPI004028D971
MRTTIIPAQITTVEDKIAGNLNLTQLLILMIPVIWTAIVYTLFFPAMRISFYKLPVILIVLIVCFILSLRVNGVVIFNWLFLLAGYRLRPRIYVPIKTDPYLREIDLPVFEKEPAVTPVKAKETKVAENIAVSELVRLEKLLHSKKFSLRYKINGKGGLHVAYQPVK